MQELASQSLLEQLHVYAFDFLANLSFVNARSRTIEMICLNAVCFPLNVGVRALNSESNDNHRQLKAYSLLLTHSFLVLLNGGNLSIEILKWNQ